MKKKKLFNNKNNYSHKVIQKLQVLKKKHHIWMNKESLILIL